MANYPTDIHGPAASARSVTNKVAYCRVCEMEWQIQSAEMLDAKSCPFCGAPEAAIVIRSEAPEDGDAVIYGGGEI